MNPPSPKSSQDPSPGPSQDPSQDPKPKLKINQELTDKIYNLVMNKLPKKKKIILVKKNSK
jgi:hypothetical protein